MTFFKIRNSGRDNHTTAIINAKPVPNGIPLTIRDWTIGIIPLALVYIGTHNNTANGTPYQDHSDKYISKNQVGTNPCISHQIATHTRTYGKIFFIKSRESLTTDFHI